MPRMPWSVLATSSASAYCRRIVSSRIGPRAASSASSSSARRASTIFLRVSASSRSSPSRAFTRSSSSVRIRVIVLTRRTSPLTTQRRLPASMMAWNTSCAGTRKKSSVTCPRTSSVTSMFTLYCWASRRSAVGTLASRRLSVTRSAGRRLAHASWGWAAAGPPGSVRSTRASPDMVRSIGVCDRMVTLTSSAPPRAGHPALEAAASGSARPARATRRRCP